MSSNILKGPLYLKRCARSFQAAKISISKIILLSGSIFSNEDKL